MKHALPFVPLVGVALAQNPLLGALIAGVFAVIVAFVNRRRTDPTLQSLVQDLLDRNQQLEEEVAELRQEREKQ